MTQIQFTESAVGDLVRLREFIAVNNPEAAARVSLRIRQAIAKLATFPEVGRPILELENVRELIAGNYVVRYRYSQGAIFVLRIWHGKEYRNT